MRVLIAIPARYGSSRFPGKPLVKINGKEMLLRVWEIAKQAAAKFPNGVVECAVGTEDQRIIDFCKNHNIICYMTAENCLTGTDRVREVMEYGEKPEFVVNLQGDNPFCSAEFVAAIIKAYLQDNLVQVVTPVAQLSWAELKQLREHKKITPFSGTCAIVDPNTKQAIWFSKNIIPAIRQEDSYRKQNTKSPVLQHIGLYGYTAQTLIKIANLPETQYEHCEGLEQLRFLENGIKIKVVEVELDGSNIISGIDSPEDLARAEELFR